MSRGLGVLFRSPNEQVWTGLRWSPPDVTSGGAKSWGLMSRGGEQGVSRRVWCPGWRGCPAMWPIPWCIWCYLTPSLVNRHTPVHNITFSQIRLWAVTMQWHLKMDVWDSIKSQDKRDTMVTVTVTVKWGCHSLSICVKLQTNRKKSLSLWSKEVLSATYIIYKILKRN